MNPLTERHVQAVWYDAALRPKRLVSRRGSEVAVVSPGEWNLGAGPDFRNAVLEVGQDRRRIVGTSRSIFVRLTGTSTDTGPIRTIGTSLRT